MAETRVVIDRLIVQPRWLHAIRQMDQPPTTGRLYGGEIKRHLFVKNCG